ncbi:hypothetical protein PMAYCL1PPCAC_25315, partial [Pristionchus mayeri]
RMSPPRKKAKEDKLVGPQTGNAAYIIRFKAYLNKITACGVFSNEIEVRGLRWKLYLKKKKSHLGVYLVHRTYQSTPWSVDISAQFKLLCKNEEQHREIELNETFRNVNARCGFAEFIPWKELIDKNKGFRYKNTINIEAQFTLSNIIGISPVIDCTNPDEQLHDVAFVIDGEKLYASKKVLAIHSPVFKAMLFGNFAEREKKEIVLNDVDRESFLLILKLLYDPTYNIKDDIILLKSLLALADRYDIKVVFDRVEEVLVDLKSFSPIQKVLFADNHDSCRFVKLPMKALQGILDDLIDAKSKKRYERKLLASEEFIQLSDAAKAECDEVFERHYKDLECPEYNRQEGGRTELKEGVNLIEGCEKQNLVASGCFQSQFDMYGEDTEGILGRLCSATGENYIGGLMWSLDAKCDVLPHADGKNRLLVSLMLVVNEDRPTKFDWKAEGIMEISAYFLDTG